MTEMKQKAVEATQHDYSSIEPVPPEGRHIGFLSMTATWGGVSLQPSSWTIGGTMICAGLGMGIISLLLGSAYTFLIVALFGYMTFKTGLSSMGMTRFTLGVRGTKIVTVASIINSLGWVTVTAYLAAITISYILKMIFGTPAVGEPGCEPIMIASCIVIVVLEWLAIAVDGSRTLKLFQSIMMVALIVFSIVIFIALFRIVSIEDIHNFTIPEDVRLSVPACFDTLVAGTVTIAIFGGDLSRYAVKKNTAKYAGFAGGFPALVVFGLMAILGILASYVTTGTFDLNNSNPSTLATSLGLGIPALIIVLFSTITTSMLDIYTITNSATNLFEHWSYKKASIVAGLLSIALCWIPVATTDFMTYFFSFIDVVGAVFPPLLVIMMADFYLIHKQHYVVEDAAKVGGQYWFTNGYNVPAIVSWLIGAAIYFALHGYLLVNNAYISNVILSMVLALVIYLVMVKLFGQKAKI